MSLPLFKNDILFSQRILSICGYYKGTLDGRYGKLTQAAEDEFEKFYNDTADEYGKFDLRSENVISTLLPQAQVKARQFMTVATHKFNEGIVKLLSGTRTYVEQDRLYAQGRSATGRIVTNARGGQSNHNFAIAWDAGIFQGGQYNEGRNAKENQAYLDLAKLIKENVKDLEWGGDWKSIVDYPHYQLPTNKSIHQVELAFEAGKKYTV